MQIANSPTARVLARGFTLMELLVVLVIIGVVISVASVSVRVLGSDSEIEEQVRRLAVVMTQAKEEAELQGREVGVFLDRSGYEFFLFDARQQTWLPVSDDDLFAARQLPEGLNVRLWMEGREVILKAHGERTATASVEGKEQASTTTAASAGPSPQITLLSSGEVNSFEVRVDRDGTDHVWRIASQPDNSLLAEEVHANL
ncbi:MAG: type II secretion system minor pseudopilin GspH [Candidatus Obscuribacterales bacterium]|nr:type II secretion system minor pseudopilin GspH [Steroidobacteraceae bacterium]